MAADIITATDVVNDNNKAKVENTKRQKYNNYLGSGVIILHQVRVVHHTLVSVE